MWINEVFDDKTGYNYLAKKLGDKARYMKIFVSLYNRPSRFRVIQHSKGHKVKDGALKMALSPIAICGRAASYWRRGDNANTGGCCEGDGAAKVDHHSNGNPKLGFIQRTRSFQFSHD